MKTLEDIKQGRAYEMDYSDWEEFIYSVDDPNILDMEFDEVANIFAREVAREALKNASENFLGQSDFAKDTRNAILNEDNIPEL